MATAADAVARSPRSAAQRTERVVRRQEAREAVLPQHGFATRDHHHAGTVRRRSAHTSSAVILRSSRRGSYLIPFRPVQSRCRRYRTIDSAGCSPPTRTKEQRRPSEGPPLQGRAEDLGDHQRGAGDRPGIHRHRFKVCRHRRSCRSARWSSPRAKGRVPPKQRYLQGGRAGRRQTSGPSLPQRGLGLKSPTTEEAARSVLATCREGSRTSKIPPDS